MSGLAVVDTDGRRYEVPRDIEAEGGAAVEAWLEAQRDLANQAPGGPAPGEGTGQTKRGRGNR
jgi:hypothetical protein